MEWDYPQFHLSMHCYLCHVESGHLELKEHEAAKRAHKFNSQIDASVEIFKLGAPYWMNVYQTLTKEELLSYGDCGFIRSIATYIGRGSLPSPAQCRRLLKIVEKAEDKGYIMP